METGNESIEMIMRRRRILLVGFVTRIEDARLPKCVMFGELVGARAAFVDREKVDGVFTGRPQSFWPQRRPVDDGNPGRGEMAQDGGTKGGTLHSEMDRCRESQGWTTTCSGMPEHDGKDQGEDSPKQAGSCWLARHS